MEEVYDFLKECGVFFLATEDGEQPRVRPFGAINVYEGKLYIQTGKIKNVSKQMQDNPNVELCGYIDGKWISKQRACVHNHGKLVRETLRPQ